MQLSSAPRRSTRVWLNCGISHPDAARVLARKESIGRGNPIVAQIAGAEYRNFEGLFQDLEEVAVIIGPQAQTRPGHQGPRRTLNQGAVEELPVGRY